MLGKTLSHYRIVEELGHGGMGVVYRARDEHLPRDVALKVLPVDLFSDETARSRFRREAQTLSQLNHPNIAMVFDFDRENGVDFLAMEFVEGETLAAKVALGPLPEKEVVSLGTQIAEALEEAHEHGIIHRDLKPGNVMVTTKGRAKVLDFGLAKLLKPAQADAATASLAETQGAAVMGTLPYMSPEQLQGKPADARTDVYALGTVLYEMATGRRPFPQEQTSPLIAAILTQVPKPARELNAQVSQGLEAIIQKAMENSPEQRYQSAKELTEDLARLSVPGSALTAQKRKKMRRGVVFALACVLVVAAAALLYWLIRPLPPPRIKRAVQLTSTGFRKFGPLLSDGVRVYFREDASGKVLLQQVTAAGGDVSTVLMRNEEEAFRLIAISPDGSQILLDNTLGCSECPFKIMPATGGVPRMLGNIVGRDAAWTPDGRSILYTNGNNLFLAESDRSKPRKLVTASGPTSDPHWSPDGQRIRFTVLDVPKPLAFLWEVSADGTNLHRVFPGWTDQQGGGAWTADGNYFVFQAFRELQENLWATRENQGLFRKGFTDAVRLTYGAPVFSSVVPAREANRIFAVGTQSRGELIRYDQTTHQLAPFLSGISAEWLDFSRDGKWVTYVSFPEGNLWRSRADGSERLQLTSLNGVALLPRWSPDNSKIVFMGNHWDSAGWKIYLISPEGGTPQRLIPEGSDESDPQWSPDGNQILFGRWLSAQPGKPFALHLLDLKTNRVSTLPGSGGLRSPRWSRDGRYAVATDEAAGTLKLFDFSRQRWEILAKPGGGIQSWSKDGEYVYFQIPDLLGLFRVAIRSRKVERVVSLQKLKATGNAGYWTGLAPDDSILALRDTSIEEIYALELEAP